MTQKRRPIDRRLLLGLTLPSNAEVLKVVRSTITSLGEMMGFSSTDSCSITRAVDEALANIIRHAYRSRRNQLISVICRHIRVRSDGRWRDGLEITLVDYGPAVDPTRLSARSLDEIKPGGLGLHFIRGSMDVVSYVRAESANRLRLVRYFPGSTSSTRSKTAVAPLGTKLNRLGCISNEEQS